MSHNKKRKEITALIDNIKVHSDRLTNDQTIPILELSVILSKINRLKEKTVVLKYLLSQEQEKIDLFQEDSIEEAVQKEAIENIESNKVEDDTIDTIAEAQKVDTAAEEKTTRETAADSPTKSREEKPSEVDSTSKQQGNKQTPPVDNKVETENDSAAVHEKSKDAKSEEALSKMPDLNEQYSEEEDPSLSEQLKKQPIADLLTAIGLNERYLYANELFEGDIDAFKKIVKELNDKQTLEEARQYFNDVLMKTYDWDHDNEMVQALYLLIERRYL